MIATPMAFSSEIRDEEIDVLESLLERFGLIIKVMEHGQKAETNACDAILLFRHSKWSDKVSESKLLPDISSVMRLRLQMIF